MQKNNDDLYNQRETIRNKLHQKYKLEEERFLNQNRRDIKNFVQNKYFEYKNQLGRLSFGKLKESKLSEQFVILVKQFKQQSQLKFDQTNKQIDKKIKNFEKSHKNIAQEGIIQKKVDQFYQNTEKKYASFLKQLYREKILNIRIQQHCQQNYQLFMKRMVEKNTTLEADAQQIDFGQFLEKQNQIFLDENVEKYSQKIQYDFEDFVKDNIQFFDNDVQFSVSENLEYPNIIPPDIKSVRKVAQIIDIDTCMNDIVQKFHDYSKQQKNQGFYCQKNIKKICLNMILDIFDYVENLKLNKQANFYHILVQKFFHETYEYYKEKEEQQCQAIIDNILETSEGYVQDAERFSDENDEYNLALMNIQKEIQDYIKNNFNEQFNFKNLLQGQEKNELQLVNMLYWHLNGEFFTVISNQGQKQRQIKQVYEILLRNYLQNHMQKQIEQYKKQSVDKLKYIIGECSKQKNIQSYIKIFEKLAKFKKFLQDCSIIDKDKQTFLDCVVNDTQYEAFKTFMDEICNQSLKIFDKNDKNYVLSQDKVEALIRQNLQLQYGCMHQCPFCGSVCQSLDDNDDHEHSCEYHFPQFMRGCRDFFNDKVVFETCTSKVKSKKCFIMDQHWAHPYKEYKKHPSKKFERWNIEGNENQDMINVFQYILSKEKQGFWAIYEYKIDDFDTTIKNKKQLMQVASKYIKSKVIRDSLAIYFKIDY